MHFLILASLLACGDKDDDGDGGADDSGAGGAPDGGGADGGGTDGGGADGGGADGGGADGGADGGGSDGGTDGGTDLCTWYTDADEDGYGDPDAPVEASCEEAPVGTVDNLRDCDDEDPEIHPGVEDLDCDNVDDDCDGEVDGGWRVPEDQPNIQVSLNSAPDGGVVCIGPGTYDQSFNTNGRRISIIGREGPLVTFVTGAIGMPVVTVESGEGSDTVIRGLTLSGGLFEDGAGLHIVDSSPTLEDLIIEGNDCAATGAIGMCRGTGVYISGGSPVFRRVEVRGNTQDAAQCLGAGVYVNDGAEPLLEDVLVQENSQTSTENSVFLYGSGLYLGAGTTTLSRVEVRENQQASSSGSGATRHGGAGFYAGGDVYATDLLVANNSQDTSGGAGLYLDGAGINAQGVDNVLDITGAVVQGNTALATSSSGYGYAPGIAVTATELRLEDVQILDNELHMGSGGVGEGGGLYVRMGTASLRHVEIAGNLVDAGGLAAGAGAYFTEQDLDAENLLLAGNALEPGPSALTYGAGAYLSHGTARIRYADVVGNSTDYTANGLGLYVHGSMDLALENVNIVGHTTGWTDGRAFYVGYPDDVTVSFDWTNMYDNGSSAVQGTSFSIVVDGNLEVDPLYTDTSSTDPADWELHLGAGSACIDAGDEAELDVDGSRSDIGAYGGPYGSWP